MLLQLSFNGLIVWCSVKQHTRELLGDQGKVSTAVVTAIQGAPAGLVSKACVADVCKQGTAADTAMQISFELESKVSLTSVKPQITAQQVLLLCGCRKGWKLGR
jgi:hypothetical protein